MIFVRCAQPGQIHDNATMVTCPKVTSVYSRSWAVLFSRVQGAFQSIGDLSRAEKWALAGDKECAWRIVPVGTPWRILRPNPLQCPGQAGIAARARPARVGATSSGIL